MSVTSTVASAIKHNTSLFDRLRKAVVGEAPKFAAVASAAALYSAMNEYTVHDSSKAAANWDLQVNGSNPYGKSTSQIEPGAYADKVPSYSSTYGIGNRGDSGVNAEAVINIKAHKYGFVAGGSNVVTLAKGGWLFNSVKGNKNSIIYLFNPIGKYGPYRHSAIPDFSSFAAQLEAMALKSANGYKPIFVRDVSLQTGIPVRAGL